ncbi:MAG: hypothetical protein WBV79_16545 [Rhodomicrobium sp.]
MVVVAKPISPTTAGLAHHSLYIPASVISGISSSSFPFSSDLQPSSKAVVFGSSSDRLPGAGLGLDISTCTTLYFYYLRYETVKDASVCGSTSQLFSMSLRDRSDAGNRLDHTSNQMSLYAPDYQLTGSVLLERLMGRQEVYRVFLLCMIV